MKGAIRKEKHAAMEGVVTARYKKFGHRFEILLHKNRTVSEIEKRDRKQKLESLPEGCDIDSLLYRPLIFSNAAKQEPAKLSTLQEAFGTTELKAVAQEILFKGEIMHGKNEERQERTKTDHAQLARLSEAICLRITRPKLENEKRTSHLSAGEIEHELKSLKYKLCDPHEVKLCRDEYNILRAIRALYDSRILGDIVRSLKSLVFDFCHKPTVENICKESKYLFYSAVYVGAQSGLACLLVFDPYIQEDLFSRLVQAGVTSKQDALKRASIHFPTKSCPIDLMCLLEVLNEHSTNHCTKNGADDTGLANSRKSGHVTKGKKGKADQSEHKTKNSMNSLETELAGLGLR